MVDEKVEKNKNKFLDFCLTYGFPIIVVLVALGALLYFDAIPLGPQKYNTTCTCEPCNVKISISNATTNSMTCCTNATWNNSAKKCDYTMTTKNITFEVSKV